MSKIRTPPCPRYWTLVHWPPDVPRDFTYTDVERRAQLDEVLDDSTAGIALGSSRLRPPRRAKIPDSHRSPLSLLLDLMGDGMSIVSGKTWKIICFVAAKQVTAEVNTRVRTSVLIPLEEFSTGVPRETSGTGLSRSSVVKAINDAVNSGLLRRERRQASNGGDLSTEYGIAWEKVAERARVRRSRKPWDAAFRRAGGRTGFTCQRGSCPAGVAPKPTPKIQRMSRIISHQNSNVAKTHGTLGREEKNTQQQDHVETAAQNSTAPLIVID